MWTEVLLALAIGFLVLKYLASRRYHLLPGPRGLPFIGNVFQLDKNSPHDTITKWSEEYGDVFKIKMFGDDFVVLNSFESIYEALVSKSNDFAGRPPSYRIAVLLRFTEDVAFSTFSKKWVFLKKIVMRTLKMYGDNLENLEMITLDLIHDMLEELKQDGLKGPIDIKPTIHRCVTSIITSIMYGNKPSKEEVDNLLKATEEGAKVLEPTGPGLLLDILPVVRYLPNKTFENLLKARENNEKWFLKEIKNRRMKHEPNNPQCFLDGLFDHQSECESKEGHLQITDGNIYGINDNLVFGGTSTTSVSLHCLIAVLINKPDIQKKMASVVLEVLGDREPHLSDRQSLPYVEAAILELLRYTTIAPLNLPHLTTVDTTINEFDIPKNTRVMFNLWKLHHNPEYWDEPWEFRPERYLDEDGAVVAPDHINRRRLLAFGAGRRVCIGETLAKNRLFLMVTSLIQHFEFLPAGPDQLPKHDPHDYESGFGIKPPNYLVKLVPRKE